MMLSPGCPTLLLGALQRKVKHMKIDAVMHLVSTKNVTGATLTILVKTTLLAGKSSGCPKGLCKDAGWTGVSTQLLGRSKIIAIWANGTRRLNDASLPIFRTCGR